MGRFVLSPVPDAQERGMGVVAVVAIVVLAVVGLGALGFWLWRRSD